LPLPALAIWPALTVALALLCVEARAADPAASQAGGGPQTMSIADLRPGMKGYGLTTFEGDKVERFDVEVLGVLRTWAPQGTVVMIRMSGPVLDQTGTISGMSGSPVFIDDRLLGAVAYGFPNSKLPIAGVTPIEEMLVSGEIEEAGSALRQGARRAAFGRALREEIKALVDAYAAGHRPGDPAIREIAGRMVLPLGFRRWDGARQTAVLEPALRRLMPGAQEPTLARLPIPLAVGGASPGALQALAPGLSASGFVPVQGGTAGASPTTSIQPAPGVPVGPVFVTGDIDMAAMGTLTLIDGDRVLAFGHPAFDYGEVSGQLDYPLAVGRVQTVIPSTFLSFRLTSTEGIIGRFTRDTSAAIVGRLGGEAPMFPCTVRVKGARDTTYHYQVAGYWETAPFLAYLVSALSAERWEGEGAMVTLSVRSSITLKGREQPVVLRARYAGVPVDWAAFDMVYLPAAVLTFNEFAQRDIAALDVELEVQEGIEAAEIRGVRASPREVEPGGKVELTVRLREFQGPEKLHKIELRVPEDAVPGTEARLLVCDAWLNYWIDMDEDWGFFDPYDMEGLIRILESYPEGTGLYVRASFQRAGLRYEGVPMPDLPPSAMSLIGSGPETGSVHTLARTLKLSEPTPYLVDGAEETTVRIVDPRRGMAPPDRD